MNPTLARVQRDGRHNLHDGRSLGRQRAGRRQESGPANRPRPPARAGPCQEAGWAPQLLSLPAFFSGACVQLEERFDALEALRRIEQKAVTYMGGVPTHYERMLGSLRAADASRFDLSSLKFLFGAGAAVSPQTIRAFAELTMPLMRASISLAVTRLVDSSPLALAWARIEMPACCRT